MTPKQREQFKEDFGYFPCETSWGDHVKLGHRCNRPKDHEGDCVCGCETRFKCPWDAQGVPLAPKDWPPEPEEPLERFRGRHGSQTNC